MSEEEDEEEEDEESEEELLALRREGWVCGSVAGFSAGISKTHPIRTTRHKQKHLFCFIKILGRQTLDVLKHVSSNGQRVWRTYVWFLEASFQS